MNALRVCIVTFLVLCGAVYGEANVVREVSHEDIRDAILSLVHMFRDNSDKLERHELRERQLGEQLKKSFSTVEKKQKSEEINFNTILEMLNNISKRLETLEDVATKVDNEPAIVSSNKFEEILQIKLANIEQTIQNNRLAIQDTNANINQKLTPLVSTIQNVQLVATSLEEKLAQQIPAQSNKVDAQLVELQSKLQEQILKVQENILEKTQDLANRVTENLRSSVKVEDLGHLNNSASGNLHEIKNELIIFSENEINKLQEEIGKSLQILSQEQESILTTVTNSVSAVDNLNINFQKNYDQLLKEMKGLSKIEQVLIQTADNVLDVKRRIEYGAHEVLLEVGELVTQQNKELNHTIAKRFDGISYDISNSQNGALTNLSLKIETEISQVWRQIGTMYQTLTNSADTLDKLQQHTEIYVNGSLSTLDHMEGKVGQITSRMTEVDDNLNYLLGRLSLVTQEFNQIKTGLGDALDNIRSSFHTVQTKVNDVGPGPNPIEDDTTNNYDKQLLKTQYSVS